MDVKSLVSAMSGSHYTTLYVYNSQTKHWDMSLHAHVGDMLAYIKSGDKRFDLEVDNWQADLVLGKAEVAIKIYAKQNAKGGIQKIASIGRKKNRSEV